MIPVIDLLKAQVDTLNAIGRSRMQHLQPEYLAAENERLLNAWDEIETVRQLVKYGVSL